MNNKLKLILKCLIFTTFFVPLIVIPSSYIFPFIVPKIVWFRALTLLMLGTYILLLSTNWREYRPRFSPLNIAVGLFFLSFVISTFAGTDWYHSFWDNHERMLGLFTIFHFVIYYLIINAAFKEWKDWKWFLRIFLMAGSLVMFIGFWQRYVNTEALLNKGSDRVSATLGNAIYFSGYGLFLMFTGYLLAIKEYIRCGSLRLCSGWYWFAVAGGLLGFFGIFWGGTRGTVLGLIAGGGVLCLSYIISLKEHKKVRQIMVGGMVLVLILLGICYIFKQTNFVKSIPTVGRLVNTTIDPKMPRYMAWGIAIEAWQERPIFGWGPNNFFYAFNKYYKPQFLESGWGETWFDNAHNVIMNTLAVQGGVGIITYLGLFGAGIFVLWRGFKRKEIDAHVVSVGSAFLVAHLVSLVTVFENPTSYLYFYFFLAFINSQSINNKLPINKTVESIKYKAESRNVSVGLVVVVGLVVALFIYSTDINPARANQATLKAIKNLYQNIDDAEKFYGLASTTPSPHIDDIRMDFARSADSAVKELINVKQTPKANELFDLVYGEIVKNRTLHPLDIRVQLLQAQLAFTGAQLKNDPKYLIEANEAVEDALTKSPRRQQIHYLLAPLKMNFGQVDEAVKLLRGSIDDDPKIEEGWWRLLLIYQQVGRLDEAKALIAEAEQKGVVWSEQGKQIVESIMNTTAVNK